MARRRELTLAVDTADPMPLYLQVSGGVVGAIRSGRLRPGDALPGSRSLARRLQVNRNTVLSAYAELAAEGWVTGRPREGTFVVERLPTKPPRRLGPSHRAHTTGFPLSPPLEHEPVPRYPRGVFVLTKGTPDPRLLPTVELGRAYRRVLERDGRELLVYGDQRGHRRLREQLAQMLASSRGMSVTVDELLVTRGSQSAMDLAARALVTPGDVVAVETPGAHTIRGALRLAGARLLPLQVDELGASVDELERLATQERIRAVVVTPHHQFPTTVVMPAHRRSRLMEVARTHRIAVIEDDYDHEFHYEGRPVLPLASVDTSGLVIYIGTLSKVLAPGLRIGYVAAPHDFIERMVTIRALTDLQGDLVVEAAVAELFASGELHRHIARMRGRYLHRRDALMAALQRYLGSVIAAQRPAGGMAIWATVLPRDLDIDAWAVRGQQRGVIFRSGTLYAFDGAPLNCLRLGFTLYDEDELDLAARRMADALAP
jgi:GntR family transcriptional regulator/MocR family aminotransferase